MSEVLKRTLSGIVYILLLIGALLFSEQSFLLLFTLFFLIAINEFCNLYNVKKMYGYIVALFFASSLYFIHNSPLNSLFLIVLDRKSTRLNSSHVRISYAVFCLKKKKTTTRQR